MIRTMLDNLKGYKIVLASNSPRRRELLGSLGIDFKVFTLADIDESYPPGLGAKQTAEYISAKKASAYMAEINPDVLLITADTVVSIDDDILGKPSSEADACKMLRMLSGRTHEVITGVSIVLGGKCNTFSAVSRVTFDHITDEEISYYVENFRPMDKAGAYGIQEWIGMVAVKGIEGSYFNVMGLPVQRLYRELGKIKPID